MPSAAALAAQLMGAAGLTRGMFLGQGYEDGPRRWRRWSWGRPNDSIYGSWAHSANHSQTWIFVGLQPQALSGYPSLKSGFPNTDGMRSCRNKSSYALAPTRLAALAFGPTHRSLSKWIISAKIVVPIGRAAHDIKDRKLTRSARCKLNRNCP